jgi:DeoR family transcriptional regulator, suf operon transcriptional repressor
MQHAPATLSGFRGLRAELLVALKKAARPLTAKELAGQFGLTANALRRHLKTLEDDELVAYRREVRGVGAPVYAYSLTEAGQALFPQAYAPVLTAVLQAVRETQGPEGLVALFRRQWSRLVEQATPRLAELPLAERAQLVAELRSSQGYMAEVVTTGADEARLLEHHCAIRDVAEEFPEICAAEQELIERLLGVSVERTGHILSGCSACEYVVRAAPAAPPATCCTPEELAGAAPCSACAAHHHHDIEDQHAGVRLERRGIGETT